MKNMIIALMLCVPVSALGYDVTLLPPAPVGGEGVLLTVAGEGLESCEVRYNGKVYRPWKTDAGARELYLPVGIEDKGAKEIKVRRKPQAADADEKVITLEVAARSVETVALTPDDESMRDRQPAVANQQKTVLSALKKKSAKKYWSKGFVLPLGNRISTCFALHRKGAKYSYYHKGLDISAPAGTAVKAGNAGRVIVSRKNLNMYGNTIIIDHGQGVVSCYFHLRSRLKKEGDRVARNEVIGRVGSSGWATGPHLHYGVYLQGAPVDPVWWTRFTRELYDRHPATRPSEQTKTAPL